MKVGGSGREFAGRNFRISCGKLGPRLRVDKNPSSAHDEKQRQSDEDVTRAALRACKAIQESVWGKWSQVIHESKKSFKFAKSKKNAQVRGKDVCNLGN